MCDDCTAEAKGVLGDKTSSSGPYTNRKLLHIMVDYGIEVLIESVSNNVSRSWVVISRGVEMYVTEPSVECKQSMYPDAVPVPNESLSTEQTATDTESRALPSQGATRVISGIVKSSSENTALSSHRKGQNYCSGAWTSTSSTVISGRKYLA